MKIGYFDPVQRAADKAAARRADDDAIETGRASYAAVRRRNYVFGHIDLSNARIILKDGDPIL